MSTDNETPVAPATGSARTCPKCGHTSVRRWGAHFDHERRCVNPSCGFSWDPDEYPKGVRQAESLATSLATRVVRRIKGPTIMLASGVYFDLEDPDSCHFTRRDVAHALGHICRYTGHCREFYSVAQHSVLVSRIVPEADALAGLLHDAAEAFIGDVSKPLKCLLPDFAAVEARVEASVLPRLGVPLPIPAVVKRADRILLRTEQRDLMGADGHNWAFTEGEAPLENVIVPLGPREATLQFLERWEELDPAPNTQASDGAPNLGTNAT